MKKIKEIILLTVGIIFAIASLVCFFLGEFTEWRTGEVLHSIFALSSWAVFLYLQIRLAEESAQVYCPCRDYGIDEKQEQRFFDTNEFEQITPKLEPELPILISERKNRFSDTAIERENKITSGVTENAEEEA